MEIQSEIITVGSQVEIILRDRAGQQETLQLCIVPSEAADFANGYLGLDTPLAKVLVGERAGTLIPYLKDDIYSIEVISVTQSVIEPPVTAAEKRKAAFNKAVREVQDTNAIVFASSFSGKWGDYDPESIPKEDKPKEE